MVDKPAKAPKKPQAKRPKVVAKKRTLVSRAETEMRPELGDELDNKVYTIPGARGRTGRIGAGNPAYKPDFAGIARILCRGGATDVELAEAFDVQVLSIWRWKVRYPAFAEATQDGKEVADNRVKQALYRRAVGYSYREEVITTYQGAAQRHEVIKEVPPDVKAALNWLYNRDEGNWKVRQEITGKNGTPLIPQDSVSKIELARILAFRLQQGQDEKMKMLAAVTIEGDLADVKG